VASAHSAAFAPPSEASIPDNEFGKMVRKGEQIFTHTQKYAGKYVGNQLNCSNCHLNAGRRPDSAPLWAAWVRYPRYRSKNDKINSYADRLQGCFRFSMNGKAPPADGEVITALSAYSYWLATGAPTGKDLKGFGYPKQGYKPPKTPDYARGKKVFKSHCALCHGDDGQGQQVAGQTVFPALWGPESFNWGAGMHSVKTAAAFIKANMPLSRGGTLSDQQAWDVAYYMDSHERPQDPRFTGNVAATRKKYHDSKWSLYGKKVNGHLLGKGTGKAQ
jgi:thiosulfate dehydrogenase